VRVRHDEGAAHRPGAVRIRLCTAAFLLLSSAMILSAQDTPESLARAVVQELAKSKYPEIVATFTPEMAKALPADKLGTIWRGVMAQGGAWRGVGAPATFEVKGGTVVTIPLHFEKATLDAKVTVVAGKVAGLVLAPARTPLPRWSSPPYSERSAFSETNVTIGAAPWALPGTLALPTGRTVVPAIVLVHGSGPGDRNESVGANRPFQDLAEGLASRGIAVLRYDKRTKVYGAEIVALKRFTVREETIDDVLAAVKLLRTRPEIDPKRIFVLGHSLGGTLAPKIAMEDPSIAGLIIMAGATLPLFEKIVEQAEYLASLDGPPGEAAKKQIAELRAEAARAAAAKSEETGAPILGAPPSYWADLNAYDTAAAAAQLTLPLLILQGGRDYQVTSRDLERYKQALFGHANVTLKEFPILNHLFISGEGKSTPEEYSQLGHVDPQAIEAISSFVGGVALH
jgi:dienelactone hydrolase